MNNSQIPEDGRIPEVRYDPSNRDYRKSFEYDSANSQQRQGLSHAAKLASLSVVFSFMVVIGSLAIVINNRTQSVNTRADTTLEKLPTIAKEELVLTGQITQFPLRYKGRTIPKELYEQANIKYINFPDDERRAYIINRVVLYYIYDDILSTNNVPFQRASHPLTFEGLEAALPGMSAIMKAEYPQPELFVQENIDLFEF